MGSRFKIQVILLMILLHVALSLPLHAQESLHTELQEVMDFYRNKERFGMSVTTTTYSISSNKKTPVNVIVGVVKKNAETYYYSLDGTEILASNYFSIMVNNKYRIIQYKEIDEVESDIEVEDKIFNTDILSDGLCQTTTVSEKGGERTVTCVCNTPQLKKINVVIDIVDLRLISIQYEHVEDAQGQKLFTEVVYSDLDPNQLGFLDDLEKENYVQLKGNELVPVAKYKGYEVIEME